MDALAKIWLAPPLQGRSMCSFFRREEVVMKIEGTTKNLCQNEVVKNITYVFINVIAVYCYYYH